MSKTDTHAPVNIGEDEPVKMTMKTLCVIIAGAVVIAGAGVRWELKLQAVQDSAATHTKQLEAIQTLQAENHDAISRMRYEQRTQGALLNYIAAGRHGDPPAKADDGTTR